MRRSEGSGPWRRSDGRWEATYVDQGRRRSVYGPTKSAAAKKLRERLALRDTGVSGDSTSLGAWVDRWLSGLETRDLAPNTKSDYRYRLGLVPDWLRKLPLDQVAPDHVEDACAQLLRQGHAGSTVAKVRSLLGQVLDQAVRYGRTPRNAARLSDPVKTRPPELVVLTPDEAARLAEVAARHRVGTLLTVGLGGVGLRKSEAIGLQWSAVDLEQGSLTVGSQLARAGGVGHERRGPKSRAGRRTIQLPGSFVEQLRRRKALEAADRLAAGPAWEPSGLVWPSRRGTPLGHRSVNRLVERLCAEAGVRRVTPHGLRHSAGAMMLAAGVGERVIMDILGHDDLSMILRYQHVLPEVRREAADRMELWLRER